MIGKEIRSINDDQLSLNRYVEMFIDNYITSSFSGTVFLNGKWGVGKSSYLNMIKSETVKTHPKIKFININFWTEQWEDKPFELIAKKLNTFWYFVLKFFPIIIVMILAGIRFLLDVFTVNTNEITTRDISIWIILILMIILVTFFIRYVSLEDIFLWYLKKIKNNNMIFVCDDFDRIDRDKRTKLYSFISKINCIDNFTLIAIGDYRRLLNENDDSLMLQKIFNNIENMPSEYSAGNVWEIFELELEQLINTSDTSMEDKKLITEIRDIFKYEERTFRDAFQLLELFRRTYTNERKAVVNSGEYLAICYVYQLYNPVYTWVMQNSDFIYKVSVPDSNQSSLTKTDKKTEVSMSESIKAELRKTDIDISDFLAELIVSIFNQNKEKLLYTSINNGKYLRNYKVENINLYISLTSEDIKGIFVTKNSSVKELEQLLEREQFEDFHELFKIHYLIGNPDDQLEQKYNSLLVSLSIIMSKSNLKSPGMFSLHPVESLFYKVRSTLVQNFECNEKKLFETHIESNNQMDLSQKLFVLPKFVAANNENDKLTQLSIVKRIFKKHSTFNLLTQFKPMICLYFYTTYYSDFEINYDHSFNSIFELNNEEFVKFIEENLVSTILSSTGNYKVIHLNNYMFNESFKNKFLHKIDSLSKENSEYIRKLIEKGKGF